MQGALGACNFTHVLLPTLDTSCSGNVTPINLAETR